MKQKNFRTSITLILFGIFSLVCNAQNVGINTINPQATLDVVGDLNIRKNLQVSDADGQNINSGLKGQALFSRGSKLSPEWKDVEGTRTTYRIRESTVLTDTKGVVFNNNNKMEITPEFAENSSINDPVWKEIAGLKSSITPTDKKNRVLITLQTMCHSNDDGNVDYLFSVGIFIDQKLRAVRPLNLIGRQFSFEPSTLYDSFENLPIKDDNAPYDIQVAVCQRYRNIIDGNSKTGTVSVGTDSGKDNANSWMNKTSLKVELYELFID